MRLGLTLPPHASGPRPAAASDIERAVELATAADQAGFSTLYVEESHLAHGDGFANPFAVAAAASARVQSAWLAVRPLLGLHHPLRLVEQANLLDVLTRGRYLTVLADDEADEEYARFGTAAPCDGQLDELIDTAAQAWAYEWVDDGPPLEFSTSLYSSRMAGRLMPTTYNGQPPLVARAASTEASVAAAARRGWPVHLGPVGLEQTRALAASYRQAVTTAGHHEATTRRCLDWLVGSVVVDTLDAVAQQVEAFDATGVAELRLHLSPGVRVEDLLSRSLPRLRRVPVGSN